jgi:phenylalanyl-tRNA synthetase beta chain
MRTESQTRWEKGVDPYLAEHAIRYAAQLLTELADARWTGGGDAIGDLATPATIAFRPERPARVIGLDFDEPSQRERLGRLGFDVDASWNVTVPTWRARDVRREIDLVEEVARFRLEDVPTTLPVRQAMFGRLTHFQRLRRQVEDVLVGAGFYEAYTYSLQPSDPDPEAIELPVPLSAEQRFLRTTLVRGLTGAAQHNVDRGNSGIRLFEVAHVYLPVPGTKRPRERWHLGGIVEGPFADAKGAVEGVFAALQIEPRFERAQALPLSPVGASVQGGWVAQHALGTLDGEWSAFELDLAELFKEVPERILYRDVITYPPLREDLAFVVSEGAPAGDLMRAARDAAGEDLREVRFLSDYRGVPIPAGKKSVAFALVFQSSERTLTDEDAVRLRAAIVKRLADEFAAELRA